MTTKKASTKKSSHGLAIGAGIAALAATAAGAYYLYGTKSGKKNRKAIASWTLKMKAEVMDEIEHLKDINKEKYEEIVKKVAGKYSQIKNVDPAEVKALAQKMHDHWKDIQKDINSAVKKASK